VGETRGNYKNSDNMPSYELPMSNNDSERLLKRRGYFSALREKISGLVRIILSDSNSRNLLGFLVINLTFAFVELFYGVITNSLGLISDSFHMFFDCTGLLAGLVASVITKWRANDKYSYGYVRAEILAGFINGLFLLFISFFIFSEAVERLVEPPEVKHERLLPVSIAGFIVNLIGIFIFQHGGAGHGHSHGGGGGDSHGHSHGNESNHHGHSHGDGHSHNKGHGHSHHGHSHEGSDSQIMKGVFLHILADTLGSVGVIISAILMYLFDWMIADPICSIFIAIMIALSVGSLIADSVKILMQRQPEQLDGKLQECYNKVASLQGVQGVHETNFWTLCTNYYVGGVKIEVSRDADPKYVVTHTQLIFRAVGVTQLYVQLDYEQSTNTYKNLQNPNFY